MGREDGQIGRGNWLLQEFCHIVLDGSRVADVHKDSPVPDSFRQGIFKIGKIGFPFCSRILEEGRQEGLYFRKYFFIVIRFSGCLVRYMDLMVGDLFQYVRTGPQPCLQEIMKAAVILAAEDAFDLVFRPDSRDGDCSSGSQEVAVFLCPVSGHNLIDLFKEPALPGQEGEAGIRRCAFLQPDHVFVEQRSEDCIAHGIGIREAGLAVFGQGKGGVKKAAVPGKAAEKRQERTC